MVGLFCVWVSCSDSHNTENTHQSIPVLYARNFQLDSSKQGVLLTIGEVGDRRYQFLLAPNKPENIAQGVHWIKTPVKRVISMAGTDIGMLSRLGLSSLICGVSDGTRIYNKGVLQAITEQRCVDFRQTDPPPFERIIGTKANVITYSYFGRDFPHHEALAKSKVLCIPILDWKEHHPLGKAEWIKVYGYLCGKPNEADDAFTHSVEGYQKLKSTVPNAKRPSVFSGNQTGEIWFCPAGDSYEALLIQDAGGNYVYKNTKGVGSLSLSPEKVFIDNKHTTFWINPGVPSKDKLQKIHPRATLFEAFQKNNILCYSVEMNKYWETAACYPEKVLFDLISIFQGKQHDSLNFYHRLK